MPTEGTGFLPHRAPAVRAVMNPVHYICAIRQANKIPQTPAVLYFEEGGREKLERGSWPVDALKLSRGQRELRSARGALMAHSSQRRERRNARRHGRRFDLAGCAGTSKRRRAADGPSC